MSFVATKVQESKWCWRPEPVFRDFDNNGTKDETNANTGTFYHTPVFIGSENMVHIKKTKEFSKRKSGSVFTSHVALKGYKSLKLTFEGPVIDLSWLYFLGDSCTTADNTPAGQTPTAYTHTWISTDARVNPPKSFELLHYIPNDKTGGGESQYDLYTGCIVTGYTEKGKTNGDVVGIWEVEASNIVAGTVLTTPGFPAYPTAQNFTFGNSPLTWTKATTAYNGRFLAYEFSYKTDKRLSKNGSSYYPTNATSPNNIDIKLQVTVEVWETDYYDDSQDDHTSALDKDISIKVSRNDTNDFHTFAIAKALHELVNEGFQEGNLIGTHSLEMNPLETGFTTTITEVNALDDDRYET